MLFCHIDYLDENFALRQDAYVAVRDGRIAHLGSDEPPGDWGEHIDGRHRLLLPGLYNTHCHAAMTLLRGYAEGLPLDRWLHEKVFPFEAQLTPAAIGAGARLAIAEMLRFGTVSFSDMYFSCEETAQAVLESGIKCNLSRSLACMDDRTYEETPEYPDSCRLLRDWNGAGDGRIQIDLCLHAEYSTTPRIVSALAAHAAAAKVGIQLHLSETRAEHEACLARRGMTPTAYFASLGVLDVPLTAAHCVWVTPEDRALLREHNASAACCPASNLKLASGFVDVPALLRDGVRVTLGTDGTASNNNLNQFRDLTLLSLLAKGASGDPAALSPQEALAIATRNGAEAQRRFDCGLIAVGRRADLCMLDTDQPWYTPGFDRAADVVYAAQGSDVVMTMVDGTVLYRNGEYTTLDLEKIRFDAAQAAQNIRRLL